MKSGAFGRLLQRSAAVPRALFGGNQQNLGNGSQTMFYVKRSVPVQAIRWWKRGDHPAVQYKKNVDLPRCGICTCIIANHGVVETNHGYVNVCPGNWIITSVSGEHYPCTDDVFTATYDLAPNDPEVIVSAAYRNQGSVYVGRRHDDAMKSICDDLDVPPPMDMQEGFLTSHRRFVDRYEAAKLAHTAGQIKRIKPGQALCSGDLW